MPIIKFESDWLKINNNVEDGDNIRFLNTGEQDAEGHWVFLVGVVRDGKVTHEKKFQLSKTNFDVVDETYGNNSDEWVGKEMKVIKIKVRNPSSGQVVDGISLEKPAEVKS